MIEEYVEKRENAWHLIGSRVFLESVVYQFLQGKSPEAIAQSFPSLSLVQIYGGITFFYLARRSEIDVYMRLSPGPPAGATP